MRNSRPNLTLTPNLARDILSRPKREGSLSGLNMSWDERWIVEDDWGKSKSNSVMDFLKELAEQA